jgi:hypothetical protein
VGSLAELEGRSGYPIHGKGVKIWSHAEREGAVVAGLTPGAHLGVVFGVPETTTTTKVMQY